jgi:hypothetical protein
MYNEPATQTMVNGSIRLHRQVKVTTASWIIHQPSIPRHLAMSILMTALVVLLKANQLESGTRVY